MADDFDRARFTSRLVTRRLGRQLLVRELTASTNDDAWDALATLGDGVAVVAFDQTRGRGRAGRRWVHARGKGLALSVAMALGCDVRQAGIVPLAAGLAVAQACHALSVPAARLKWPNDVLVRERKLAGVLCELRRVPGAGEAVVIGVGLNVRQSRTDFPGELSATATSLHLEGSPASIEDAAAEVLNRLEPLWDESQEGDRGAVLDKWSRSSDHWGRWVSVRTPSGGVSGIAVRLNADGGLVLRTEAGVETSVVAGDVLPAGSGLDVA